MISPTERYGEFERWIPETDIDGVDTKNSFLSEVENVDLDNGFIKNAIAPSERVNPTEILDEITNGYELLSCKYFVHEVRGGCFVYILWKTTGNLLKVYIEELKINTVQELNFDPQNSDVTISEKPYNINYSLVKNQLKINLNSFATYNTALFTCRMQMTLVYISADISYEATTKYQAGWLLFPRWLGHSYKNDNGLIKTTASTDTTLTFEGAIDTGKNSETISGSGVAVINSAGEGHGASNYFLQITQWDDSGTRKEATYTIANIVQGASIEFYMGGLSPKEWGEIQVTAYNLSGEVIATEKYSVSAAGVWEKKTFNFPGMSITAKVVFQSVTYKPIFQSGSVIIPPYMYIDDVTIKYDFPVNYVLVVKNADGQRGVITSNTADDSILNKDSKIQIPLKFIDWRVVAYEVYYKYYEESIYVLGFTKAVDGTWTKVSTNEEATILFDTSLGITTLNFNYGLGASVRTDDQPLREIFGEVFYKGRTYFVSDDSKVYQSHLSGTGQWQPDSFPYDESVDFGYFITNNDEINKQIAITPLEELLIITEKRDYVYVIQGGQGIVYRQIKVTNGGKPISSRNSIMRDLGGLPTAEVLGWSDDNGIYIYGGGVNAPTDIAKQTHKNYWLKRTDTSTSIGFYIKAKNEYWQVLGTEVIIYELSFGTFKRYKYAFTIKEYVGEIDSVLYLLDTDNKIRIIDFQSESKMSGYVVTHYNTNTVVVGQYPIKAPEHETKILQEIYIAVKNVEAGIVKYIIIYDNNTYDEIYMRTDILTDLLPAPLLIRYGKIKIKLILPPSNAEIRELGYSFDVPGQAPAQAVQTAIQGIGMSSGKQAGIGL